MTQLSVFDLQLRIAAFKAYRQQIERLTDRPDAARHGAKMMESREYQRSGELLAEDESKLREADAHEA